jgi:hypothetical protein
VVYGDGHRSQIIRDCRAVLSTLNLSTAESAQTLLRSLCTKRRVRTWLRAGADVGGLRRASLQRLSPMSHSGLAHGVSDVRRLSVQQRQRYRSQRISSGSDACCCMDIHSIAFTTRATVTNCASTDTARLQRRGAVQLSSMSPKKGQQ